MTEIADKIPSSGVHIGPVTRELVFGVVEGERAYQDSLAPTSDTDGKHTVTEFILYMEDYIAEARQVASRTWGPDADRKALDIIRKVTGLGVACMEQNGVVARMTPRAGRD